MSKPAHPPMRQSIQRFARAQRSPRTATTYSRIAAAFLSSVASSQNPGRRDVELFLARPLVSGARPSASTYNQQLAALRAFGRFGVSQGHWSDDPTEGIRFVREPEKEPPVLIVHEVQNFFRAVSAASRPEEHERDRAILALLFALGLRLSELVRLDVVQVDLASKTLLGVVRKGGRQQSLPLEAGAVELLQRWLEERPAFARPDETALFVSRRGTRLSGRTVERLFERLRRQVGTPKHVTPHTARHSFITIDLALGADISVVSRLAGHASVTTTMKYRHLLDHEPRAAVDRLGVVFPEEILRGNALGPACSIGPELVSAKPANDNGQISVDDQENLGARPPVTGAFNEGLSASVGS